MRSEDMIGGDALEAVRERAEAMGWPLAETLELIVWIGIGQVRLTDPQGGGGPGGPPEDCPCCSGAARPGDPTSLGEK